MESYKKVYENNVGVGGWKEIEKLISNAYQNKYKEFENILQGNNNNNNNSKNSLSKSKSPFLSNTSSDNSKIKLNSALSLESDVFFSFILNYFLIKF